MFRVVIVDDEPVMRRGLLYFVDWKALDCEVVFEAANGLEAEKYLETSPADIVITDIKMPGISGIELAKYIHERHPGIKTIILTAYEDFSYAQSAIKYGVIDFIVKSLCVENISEAVNKAKALILQDREKEEKFRVLEETMHEKLIKDIFNGIICNQELIETRLSENEISYSNFFVILYQMDSLTEEDSDVVSEDNNILMTSVKNFISMSLKEHNHHTYILSRKFLASIVSFKEFNPTDLIPSVIVNCNEILEMVESFTKFTMYIGISEMHETSSELAIAFKECKKALSANFYSENHISIYIPEHETESENHSVHVNSYIDEIINSVQQGNKEDAVAGLARLFEEFKLKKTLIDHIIVSGLQIASNCFRLLANNKLALPDAIKSESFFYRQVRECLSMQKLKHILQNLIAIVTDEITSNKRQYSYLVREVNSFIKENYAKNINLQIIADYIHVNSSYLSRAYKKETGESVIDALNRFRIDRAKTLLRGSNKKIFEIASEVGIPDPTYFTHVFTKYTGMSPKEFKLRC